MLNLSKLMGFNVSHPNLDFVAAGAVGSGVNPVAALPVGHIAGDLLVILATATTGATFTSPGGWTVALANGDTANTNLCMWWKIDSGSEADVTLTNGNASAVAAMVAYRPAAASPLDVAGTLATSGSATIASTTLTTTAVNDLVLTVYAAKKVAGTWTTIPAGTNTRVNAAGTTNLNALLVVDEHMPVPGATTSRTAIFSAATNTSSFAASFKQGL